MGRTWAEAGTGAGFEAGVGSINGPESAAGGRSRNVTTAGAWGDTVVDTRVRAGTWAGIETGCIATF